MTTFDWPIERMPSDDKADTVLTVPELRGSNWDGHRSYILSTRKSYQINFTILAVNHYRAGSHLGVSDLRIEQCSNLPFYRVTKIL